MKTCEKCNLSFDDDKKFCYMCGSPLTFIHQTESKEETEKHIFEDRLKADPFNVKILDAYAKFLLNNQLTRKSDTDSIQTPEIRKNDAVTKEMINKAQNLLLENQVEEAIEIFKLLHEKGLNDKTTTIYCGIDKALNTDYKAAIKILHPILSNEDLEQNNIHIDRGFLYLTFSLCQRSADLPEIKQWAVKIDHKTLRRNQYPLDEQANIEITEYIFRQSLKEIDQPSDAKKIISELTQSYLDDHFFSTMNRPRIAAIWYAIGNKYVELNLLPDALTAFQKASDLCHKENKYPQKVSEICEKIIQADKKRKRKIMIRIGSVVALTLLFVLSFYIYKSYVDAKEWELTVNDGTSESYLHYLTLYPEGKHAAEAEKYLEKYIVTDIDGNVYHTVTIGPQVWMVENLRTTKYRNGDPIPYISDNKNLENITTGAYSIYGNDISHKSVYGALYNWFAVADPREIAPAGWHIPSDDEWTILIENLGGVEIAGGKLKESGTIHWQAPNTNASNSSGFSGLPGGSFRRNESFNEMGYAGIYWSSTEYENTGYPQAKTFDLNFSTETASQLSQNQNIGLSVRCVKDY